MKFCPECGTKRLSETSKYCSECGYNFFNVLKESLPKKKIKTYLKGLDYPLEEIPVFHKICEELKLRTNIDEIDFHRIFHSIALITIATASSLWGPPKHVVMDNTLRGLVLKDETSLNQFKEFLLSYVEDNVNKDGTIKTWESGYVSPNINKNEVLDIIETVIDITSPRAAAKKVIKILRD